MKIVGARVFDPANGINGERRDIAISGGRIVEASSAGSETITADGCVALPGGLDIHSHVLALAEMAEKTAFPFPSGFGGIGVSASTYLKQGITYFVEAGLPREELDKCPAAEMRYGVLQLASDKAEPLHPSAIGRKYVGEEGIELLKLSDDEGPAPHLHLPHLAEGVGMETIEKTIRALDGRRCHLSHISHYALEKAGKRLVPAGRKAASLLERNKNISMDASPIAFGPAVAFTADRELGERIASSRGEGGPISTPPLPYSAIPHRFRTENYIDSLLFITGMEILLCVEDLSRVALSLDFPSGGNMSAYPWILSLLSNRDMRNAFLSTLNADAVGASSLKKLTREYRLNEMVEITRSSPGAILSVADRGHLGPGAVADIVLLEESSPAEEMFDNPRLVIHNGVPKEDI